MRKKILFFLLMTLFLCNSLNAADSLRGGIGVYAGLNMNMHSPDFIYSVVDEYDATFNQNFSGYGLNAGIIANFPMNDWLMFSGRFGYNVLSGDFEKYTESGLETFNLLTSLHMLEITPAVQFHNLLSIKEIYFLAGMEFGVPIRSKFSIERYSSPTQTFRTVDNQDISDASLRLALALGAGYDMPIKETMTLHYEISCRLPFTDVSKNENFKSWSVSQARFSVALTFGQAKSPEPVKIVQLPPADLKVGITEIRYYDVNGNKQQVKNIKVEDVQYTELFPFVPYVFCDENSENPSPKSQSLTGKSESGEFTINSLEADAIKINNHTLDIIGKRMQESPSSELTITGTNDGKTEANNQDLSMKRAQFAKDYLINYFKINPLKINIRAGGLPEKPSASHVDDGVQENRRIEFSSSNPKLFEPIIMKKEHQSMAEPNFIEFVPYAESEDSITAWRLEISQAGDVFRNFKGTGKPTPQQFIITPNELKNSKTPVDYLFAATTEMGVTKSTTGSIPVDYVSYVRKKSEELPDKIISKFSLILFDYDKSEVSKQDMRIIEENVLPDIKYNSNVKIYGYTDRTGDSEYNKKLAERRANSVKNVLSEKVKSAQFEVFGVGEEDSIFDNDLPIGRQLSRTVQIYVITPR